ncbi:NAD(P)-dependent oxidoreductase, partial [Staphylococcus epidermidis]|uniref:NAD(P)-dependent oxidoreductase n=1 Tax=Staphylococcus epidermidis TaxID=1282 RepID=UPI0028CB62FB
LKNPHFITINAPYNPSLHHIIHTQQFNKIKSTPYLINPPPAPILNQQSLLQPLHNKPIQPPPLHLYQFHPQITHPLKSFKN